MDTGLFWLSWSPVVLLMILAVILGRSALEQAGHGLLFALVLAFWAYETPASVILMAALDGFFTTLPLLLVILGGILLSGMLTESGALSRIVDGFRAGAGDALGRNLLITFGVGNFMEGAGVIAEPVVAPMLREAGISPAGAAALSIVGYSGLMTLELAGIIVTVLSLVTGLPLQDLGMAAAWISIPATLLMALAALLFLPGGPGRLRSLTWALAVGLLAGFSALGAAAWIGLPVSGMLAGVTVILAVMLHGSGRIRLPEGFSRDVAPFAFLLVCLFSVNTVPFLRELCGQRLVIRIALIPVHTVTLQPFFSAYLYLFLAALIAARLHGVRGERLRSVLSVSLVKGWRAFAAMGLFGAMGQVISLTGYHAGFTGLDAVHNIPCIISQGLVTLTGSLYPVFVPFLGWVGTFLTGYGVASLMLFGQLQVQAAGLLGVSATWLAAALAVGSSLGSISSPFKIALATTMVGAVGLEGQILRKTIPLGVGASFLVGGVVWLFS
jgi:lactate permease